MKNGDFPVRYVTLPGRVSLLKTPMGFFSLACHAGLIESGSVDRLAARHQRSQMTRGGPCGQAPNKRMLTSSGGHAEWGY